MTRTHRPYRCSVCGTAGHNRTNCRWRDAPCTQVTDGVRCSAPGRWLGDAEVWLCDSHMAAWVGSFERAHRAGACRDVPETASPHAATPLAAIDYTNHRGEQGTMNWNRYAERVRIDYTNHRGERAWRLILPKQFRYGTSPYHAEPQWLLEAIDLDRGTERTFALAGVHAWGLP